jgi:acyl-CoA synthetase (AMP-forming)/AMP-acid ligase II
MIRSLSTFEVSSIVGRLGAWAQSVPDTAAVIEVHGRGARACRSMTFRELDDDSSRIARGLAARGVAAGSRMALLVPPGVDFLSLFFGLLKSGITAILVDPEMDRPSAVRCLMEAEPDGWIAPPLTHGLRHLFPWRFSRARFNVVVGPSWLSGEWTLDALRRDHAGPGTSAAPGPAASGNPDEPAAIVFAAGAARRRGVIYTCGNLDALAKQWCLAYPARPGERHLVCLPWLEVIGCAIGATVVVPPTGAMAAGPPSASRIVETIRYWEVAQAIGPAALWDQVGRYCHQRGEQLPTLRRAVSVGLDADDDLLARLRRQIHRDGEVDVVYGRLESPTVARITASEVLEETAVGRRFGLGTCVGRQFPGTAWKVIRIVDGPIRRLGEAEELQAGEIGELIVFGPAVAPHYAARSEASRRGKIRSGAEIWYRTGDAGYLDQEGRFWFCGRVGHRVLTANGPLYTVPCEAVVNQHPAVGRSVLLGIGAAGRQRPVVLLEPHPGHMPRSRQARERLVAEVRRLCHAHPLTAHIQDFLVVGSLPAAGRCGRRPARNRLVAWVRRKLALQPDRK